MPPANDPQSKAYWKSLVSDKELTLTYHRRPLRFQVSQELFSSYQIDAGTRLLLKIAASNEINKVLDIGCGYGPLGLAIAKSIPAGHCVMVDKDFVAVDYARKNSSLNHIHNAEVLLSNGLDQVPPRSFTLAVTNLPAKVSKEHYYLFFHDIKERLQPGGRFYVVVISGLRQFIARSFTEVFGNHKKVKQGKVYTVAMAIKQ